MDPKTILAVCVILMVSGYTVKNLLSIVGATKTEVNGGPTVNIVYIIATVMNLIGWGISFILLVINPTVFFNVIACIF